MAIGLLLGAAEHRLHILELLEVIRHVSGQDHVYDQRSKLSVLLSLETNEDILIIASHELKGRCQVVVFQHSSVIVEHG